MQIKYTMLKLTKKWENQRAVRRIARLTDDLMRCSRERESLYDLFAIVVLSAGKTQFERNLKELVDRAVNAPKQTKSPKLQKRDDEINLQRLEEMRKKRLREAEEESRKIQAQTRRILTATLVLQLIHLFLEVATAVLR